MEQQVGPSRPPGLIHRLFVSHPQSLGLSWGSHGAGAVKIGLQLIGAGLAALFHAVIPGCFTDTAGRTVTRTYNYIQKIRAESAKPENWSDYDI